VNYTLYGARGSGSAAIEMALRAAEQPYRLVSAANWEPGPGLEALRQVNPLAQIPTLVLGDGTVLTESAAILIHLGLTHSSAALLPAASGTRALALRGLVFLAANCYAAVSVSDYPERWTTARGSAAHGRVRTAARAQLHRDWEVFADTIAPVTVMAEATPGALAFLAVVVSQWSGARQHLQTARPDFHAWLLRAEAHPRLAGTLAEHRSG
jgi:GST-like protein